ncbi:MAG: hypothetical protein FRX49_00236 [Trebouxia sp. A1-2]|nr:MAG: hypothetical protein FRX49_00236 [Trebouxia sp. A1-2]
MVSGGLSTPVAEAFSGPHCCTPGFRTQQGALPFFENKSESMGKLRVAAVVSRIREVPTSEILATAASLLVTNGPSPPGHKPRYDENHMRWPRGCVATIDAQRYSSPVYAVDKVALRLLLTVSKPTLRQAGQSEMASFMLSGKICTMQTVLHSSAGALPADSNMQLLHS